MTHSTSWFTFQRIYIGLISLEVRIQHGATGNSVIEEWTRLSVEEIFYNDDQREEYHTRDRKAGSISQKANVSEGRKRKNHKKRDNWQNQRSVRPPSGVLERIAHLICWLTDHRLQYGGNLGWRLFKVIHLPSKKSTFDDKEIATHRSHILADDTTSDQVSSNISKRFLSKRFIRLRKQLPMLFI